VIILAFLCWISSQTQLFSRQFPWAFLATPPAKTVAIPPADWKSRNTVPTAISTPSTRKLSKHTLVKKSSNLYKSMSYYRKRLSPISPSQPIDYKDTELLRKFITERGKILPRRITGLTSKQQRDLTEAVKRARLMALLPFVNQEA